VLPFTNLGNDPDQQYFADGITEDLTTGLSRVAGMFVISRNTAFTYQGKRIHTKQIGRELGVRYVLEGSVRRSANQIRVNAQLIDAETDAHLWAERFDGDIGDLFALQNEITSQFASALGVELIAAEAGRPSEHPRALDYILRGRAVMPRHSLTSLRGVSVASGAPLFLSGVGQNARQHPNRRAQRLLAEATTRWLKEQLADEVARHEQIAEEIEIAAEPGPDAEPAQGQSGGIGVRIGAQGISCSRFFPL